MRYIRFSGTLRSSSSSSSSLSCCAVSTDIPDPLSPPLPVVHCFRQVLGATFRIGTVLLYVGFIWSSCLCSSMWRGPQRYIPCEFVAISPAGFRMSASSNLDNFRDGWLVAVQQLLCGVLFAGLVQYCSQHSRVVVVKLFLHTFSQRPCSASIQQYQHGRCLEETALHFICQVWLPLDR